MRKLLTLAIGAMLISLPLAACQKQPVLPPVDLAKNEQEAKAWLVENGKLDGVVTLPSGLQYKIVKSGPDGGVKPRPQDEIKIHYEGKLTSGRVFDSSYERGSPAAFPLAGLVPGWVEALQLMKPGDEWMLYLPPELGYGENGAGDEIPPNSALIFRIELLDVLPGFSIN